MIQEGIHGGYKKNKRIQWKKNIRDFTIAYYLVIENANFKRMRRKLNYFKKWSHQIINVQLFYLQEKKKKSQKLLDDFEREFDT